MAMGVEPNQCDSKTCTVSQKAFFTANFFSWDKYHLFLRKEEFGERIRPHFFFFPVNWMAHSCSNSWCILLSITQSTHPPSLPSTVDADVWAKFACMQMGLALGCILMWAAQGPVMAGQAVAEAVREFLLANVSRKRITEWMLAIFYKFKSVIWVLERTATHSVLGIPARNPERLSFRQSPPSIPYSLLRSTHFQERAVHWLGLDHEPAPFGQDWRK